MAAPTGAKEQADDLEIKAAAPQVKQNHSHQRRWDPGGMHVTIRNGFEHFLGSCLFDICCSSPFFLFMGSMIWDFASICSYQLSLSFIRVNRHRLFPHQRHKFTPTVHGLNGEIAGVLDIDFVLEYRAFPIIEVILPWGHDAHHAEELQIAQETDPGANPLSATSAPEMAQSAPSSSAPSAENLSSAMSAPETATPGPSSSVPSIENPSSAASAPETAQPAPSSSSNTRGSSTAPASAED